MPGRAFNYMKKAISIWDRNIITQALIDSVWKLDPRKMMKNPGDVRCRGRRGISDAQTH